MTKPWFNNYENGVKQSIDDSQYESIAQMIEESLLKFSDRDAYYCMGGRITFSQLDQMSRAFAPLSFS